MHIENQEHTQQVTSPEKSIAQGDIIDELQASCLSAGNMDWIRDFFYHAGFSKEDLAPKQRCLNTRSALKTNIDWPPRGGAKLEWVGG
jgi:glutamate/tyrosine decarboxylase-like PLP-dependent enzyme